MAGTELIDHLVSREFCIAMPKFKDPDQNYHLKDLRVLLDGRQIQDIILVDNRAIGFAAVHLTNGIPIKDFEGDKRDTELYLLTQYLMQSFINPAANNSNNIEYNQIGLAQSKM